ncbi:MAG: hypothetical protein ACTSRI_02730 [Promethearchaeota archaeon]
MSKNIVKEVNNIVDNEESEFYFVNKKNRHFWHSRSTTISCKIREKNNFNKAQDFSLNIRAYLMNDERYFLKIINAVANYINEKDAQELRNYVYSRYPEIAEEELNKKMGLIIAGLQKEELKGALNLNVTVSCRLLGYEKELFYLKCYSKGFLPVFMLRTLYHVRYSHLKLRKSLENTQLKKGIEFERYLEKLKFF